MTHRFLWGSEPTDDQLLVIMQEVAEDTSLCRLALRDAKKPGI